MRANVEQGLKPSIQREARLAQRAQADSWNAPGSLTDDEQHRVARVIVEDLERSNWENRARVGAGGAHEDYESMSDDNTESCQPIANLSANGDRETKP